MAAGSSLQTVTQPRKRVVLDLNELYYDKEDCDIFFKIKCRNFTAHRLVLRGRCPGFLASLTEDLRSGKSIVELNDCTPAAFGEFLKYIYCGEFDTNDHEAVLDLYRLADKYEMYELRDECLQCIKGHFTVKSFSLIYTLALEHCEAELIKLSIAYFMKEHKDIIKTEEWKTFLFENPTESNKLFMKCLSED